VPKKKERSEGEYYRGKIRELEKENRHLHRQLKYMEKNQHIYEDIILGDKEAAFEEKTEKQQCCPECGKGKIKTINIIGRIFIECDTCHYRKKIS